MESRFEVIDAFVDGERVDAQALKRALADAEGRDYLVDAWLLREGVQEDMTREGVVPPAVARRHAARPWLVAAAMLICVVGGYAVGYRFGGPAAPLTTPPAAQLTPPPANAVPAPRTSFPVPAPTRIIQVDFATASAAGGGE